MPTPVRLARSLAPRQRYRDSSYSRVYSTSDKEVVTALPSGTVTTTVNTQSTFAIPCKRVMHDWITPCYAQRIASGEIIALPMDMCETDVTISEGALRLKNYSSASAHFDWTYTGVLGNKLPLPPWPDPISGVDNMRRFVQTAALASVNNTGFQGLVALAELQKTLMMLVRPLSSLNGLLKYLRQHRYGKGNLTITNAGKNMRSINGKRYQMYAPKVYRGPGTVVTLPKGGITIPVGSAFSSMVLGVNLGLKPLLADIDAILKKIPQAHQVDRNTERSVQTAQNKYVKNTTYRRGVAVYAFTDTYTQDVTVRATVIARDRLSVPSDFGISVLDIPGTAWELMPWSWLADYLCNIGDLLQSLKTMSQNDVLMACTVDTVVDQVTRTVTSVTLDAPYELVSPFSSRAVCTRKTKARANFDKYDVGFAWKTSKIFRPAVVQNLLSLTIGALVGLSVPAGSRSIYR